MTASNLAICVGPSILWSNDNQVMVETNYSKNVSNVAQVRICKKRLQQISMSICLRINMYFSLTLWYLVNLLISIFFQVLIEQYLSIYGDSTPAIFNSDSATASATTSAAAAGSSSSGAEDENGGGGGVRKASVASTRSNASSSAAGVGVGKSEFRAIKRPGFVGRKGLHVTSGWRAAF